VSIFNKRNVLLGLLLFGFAFVVVGALSVVGWEYSNSDDFCANACHQVHPQEPAAHQLSQHANVPCVECHIGRTDFFESALEKSGHMAHAWSLLVGYERPTHSKSMQSARACESCHPKTTHRNNTLRVITHFDDDEKNTESKTTLIMRLVGRNFGRQQSLGLNWHASGNVHYRTDDPQGLNIKWVEATLPDGSVRVYEDVRENGKGHNSQVQSGDIKTMDCITCHNRVGHPFPNPKSVVDAALSDGRLSKRLPYIKKHLSELLEQDFATEEEARRQVQKAADDYLEQYPDLQVRGIPDLRSYLQEGEDRFVDLMVRSQFLEAENVGWESFPDHAAHKDGPGCFRCHNGRLQTAQGIPISVNCTTCHSIPLVTKRDRIATNITDLIDMRVPRDHRDPAFISKHMDLQEESCADCHGEIDFGRDDKSQCSNSGCHSEDWKYLDFDALRMAKPADILELDGNEDDQVSAGES
jgi:hypothetical protein